MRAIDSPLAAAPARSAGPAAARLADAPRWHGRGLGADAAAWTGAARSIDIKDIALAVLALCASIYMLRWASPVLVPVFLGLTLSYALGPAVARLERLRLPRPAGAAVVIALLLAALAYSTHALRDDATVLVESLPQAAQKIRRALRDERRHADSALDKVQAAATQLQQAAKVDPSQAPRETRGVTRVQIEPPNFDLKGYLLSNTPRLFAAAGQATIVVLIAYFLLASGNRFRRKLVRLAGPRFAHKRIAVQGLDEVTQQIQRYLVIQVLISAIVGVATWLAYLAIGLQHAAVWGAAAFALNFIPYLGSIAVTGASALVGFVQFGSFDMAMLVGGVSIALHVLSGYVLAPWLTSRNSQLSALTAFVGVLAFGWLWGFWGLLLGVPALMMAKALCDRIDAFRPLGELLGR